MCKKRENKQSMTSLSVCIKNELEIHTHTYSERMIETERQRDRRKKTSSTNLLDARVPMPLYSLFRCHRHQHHPAQLIYRSTPMNKHSANPFYSQHVQNFGRAIIALHVLHMNARRSSNYTPYSWIAIFCFVGFFQYFDIKPSYHTYTRARVRLKMCNQLSFQQWMYELNI